MPHREADLHQESGKSPEPPLSSTAQLPRATTARNFCLCFLHHPRGRLTDVGSNATCRSTCMPQLQCSHQINCVPSTHPNHSPEGSDTEHRTATVQSFTEVPERRGRNWEFSAKVQLNVQCSKTSMEHENLFFFQSLSKWK